MSSDFPCLSTNSPYPPCSLVLRKDFLMPHFLLGSSSTNFIPQRSSLVYTTVFFITFQLFSLLQSPCTWSSCPLASLSFQFLSPLPTLLFFYSAVPSLGCSWAGTIQFLPTVPHNTSAPQVLTQDFFFPKWQMDISLSSYNPGCSQMLCKWHSTECS